MIYGQNPSKESRPVQTDADGRVLVSLQNSAGADNIVKVGAIATPSASFSVPNSAATYAIGDLIANSASPNLNRWSRAGQPAPPDLLVPGQTRADNTALLLSLVVHGVGISRLHDLMAAPWVRQGALVPILQDHFASPRIPIYAVMLQERHRLPKIRACIDYWSECLANLAQPGNASAQATPTSTPRSSIIGA